MRKKQKFNTSGRWLQIGRHFKIMTFSWTHTCQINLSVFTVDAGPEWILTGDIDAFHCLVSLFLWNVLITAIGQYFTTSTKLSIKTVLTCSQTHFNKPSMCRAGSPILRILHDILSDIVMCCSICGVCALSSPFLVLLGKTRAGIHNY